MIPVDNYRCIWKQVCVTSKNVQFMSITTCVTLLHMLSLSTPVSEHSFSVWLYVQHLMELGAARLHWNFSPLTFPQNPSSKRTLGGHLKITVSKYQFAVLTQTSRFSVIYFAVFRAWKILWRILPLWALLDAFFQKQGILCFTQMQEYFFLYACKSTVIKDFNYLSPHRRQVCAFLGISIKIWCSDLFPLPVLQFPLPISSLLLYISLKNTLTLPFVLVCSPIP